MPTVPVIDQTAGGSAAYAAPDVAPVRNAAPQQQEALGQATQQLGQQVTTIGDRLAEQVDDARVKAAEAAALGQAQSINYDPQTGFLNQRGQNAVDQYEPAKQAVTKAFQDQLDGLGNPVQKFMFRQVMQQHLLSLGQQMSIHDFQQTSQMAGEAAASRANTYATSAGNAYATYGQTDVDGKATGAFASNAATAEQETLKAVQIMKGAPAGSAAANDALLELHTQIANGAIRQMMDARAPFSKIQQMYDDMRTKWGLRGGDTLASMVKTYTEQESTRALVNQNLSDAVRASQGQPTSSTGTPDYQFPAKGGTTTAQPYDPEQGSVTLNLPQGSNLQAPADGKVTQVGKDEDGNFSLQIQHADGSVTTLTGLNSANVKVGDQVQRGEDVATSTPSVLWSLTGKDGNAVDPTRAGLAPVDLTRVTDERVLSSGLDSLRKQVTDPYLQQQATTEMEYIVRRNQQMANVAATQMYKQASDAFYSGGQQWANIPPSIFNQLTPAQQQQFKDAQHHQGWKDYEQGERFKTMDATDLVSGFIAQPDTLTPANVDAARPKLSNATYQFLMDKAQQFQSNPMALSEAKAVNSRIRFFAGQSGVNVDPATPQDKQVLIGLTYRVQQDLDRLKAQNRGNVTPDQVDKTIQQELIQRAFTNPRGATPGDANSAAQGQNVPMPSGATHVVPGSDGRMHYTDGTNDLGVVDASPGAAAGAEQSGGDNAAAMRFIRAATSNPLPNFLTPAASAEPSGVDDDVAMRAIQASSRNPLPNFPDPTGTGQPPAGDDNAALQSQSGAQQNVANQAAHLNGNTDYLYSQSNGNYPANTNKCNKFVADTISASGVPRPQVPKSGILGRLGFTRDPTAKEWATMSIPGWSSPDSVANARPGDVIAVGHHDDNEGHVGIVVAPGQTASANALTHPAGIVTINNWGFRPRGQNEEHSGDSVVVRHYVGVTR